MYSAREPCGKSRPQSGEAPGRLAHRRAGLEGGLRLQKGPVYTYLRIHIYIYIYIYTYIYIYMTM